ncbi:peroxiredoxin family protein [Sandarakinorhabdus sp. DWP1-3-1]|uniref:peroxiredoxin family protein n=1 Tax=Sandarakinorhabdus sp. DWP1-3-1 TaxID=2804627 RepID=UPI003CF72D1C
MQHSTGRRPSWKIAPPSRSLLAHWFWRGLTGLVFAGTIAMLFVQPVSAAPKSWSGSWRVTLALPGGPLPFGLEVRQGKAGVSATLINPPERMRVERVSLDGERLTLAFPSYGSLLLLVRGADDRITGIAELARSTGPASLAVTGQRGAWRFEAQPARPAADLSGRWLMTYGKDAQRGLVQLRQTGTQVSGSVQLPSGDFRYLAGEVSGRKLSLSTFDGNAATLWTAVFDGKAINGAQFTATGSPAGTAWTARRAGKTVVEPVAVEKAKGRELAFSFPDSSGRRISLTDQRYKGKVVVVTLGGAWCPNCHDEAVFMGPYATRRQREGLEVIALQFEYGTDKAKAFRLIDNFKARYKLPYPLLLAGEPTPESTKAALGALGPVKVYPSTIFIGRDGRVREVHIGWAGPATGMLNARAKADFDATVTRLLRERS